MTLKQIFQLENITCVYLHDIMKRLVANVSFDASFMCLFRLVQVVSAGCLHYSFIDFTQNNQKIVIGPCIDDIETNLPIGKHTLRAFA